MGMTLRIFFGPQLNVLVWKTSFHGSLIALPRKSGSHTLIPTPYSVSVGRAGGFFVEELSDRAGVHVQRLELANAGEQTGRGGNNSK
jgi:hypothetical protein